MNNGKAQDRFSIYQLKDIPETRDYRFESLKRLPNNFRIAKENYDFVYAAELDKNESLEQIYERFNINHPADFKGHSLSVSDVVILRRGGKETAYYVDNIGFSEVPKFLHPQVITSESENVIVRGHIGTWYTIDAVTIEDTDYFLMEHEKYGDEADNIIINKAGELILDDVVNGFDDLYDFFSEQDINLHEAKYGADGNREEDKELSKFAVQEKCEVQEKEIHSSTRTTTEKSPLANQQSSDTQRKPTTFYEPIGY